MILQQPLYSKFKFAFQDELQEPKLTRWTWINLGTYPLLYYEMKLILQYLGTFLKFISIQTQRIQ